MGVGDGRGRVRENAARSAVSEFANNLTILGDDGECLCHHALRRMREREQRFGIGGSIVLHDGGKHLVDYGVRRDDDCQDTDAGCMCCVVDYHLVPDGVVYCRVDYIYRDLHGWRVSELVQPFDVLSSADGQKLEVVLVHYCYCLRSCY